VPARRVNIKVYPDIFAYMAGGLSVDDLNGMPLLSVRDVALRGWKLSLKRGMDFLDRSWDWCCSARSWY